MSSTNRQSSQLLTPSIPRPPPSLPKNSNSSVPTLTRNVDPSLSTGVLRERPGEQPLLPAEKVYPIQIGTELFRLSGASITSDAPSYFTHFFEDQVRQTEGNQSIKTLYIDRDPTVFHDIARHLQGYCVQPLDGTHYVRLFADAQFYSLPRLISQLFSSEIFIQIGDHNFQVPRDIFSSPGDSPNFFTLGFGLFFATREETFPGLDRTGLLRPPPIASPCVPSRSANVFSQLLHLLRGYPLRIENEDHRAELLRDCRYFHLRGLEQKLIAHEITYNPERQTLEILLRLDDVKPSGISFVQDENKNIPSSLSVNVTTGWVHYARPFVDETPLELILEIGSDHTILNLGPNGKNQAMFHGLTKARVSALLQVVAGKVGTPLSISAETMVKFIMDTTTDLTLDGKPADAVRESKTTQIAERIGTAMSPESKKRKLDDGLESVVREWKVRTGQWRLRVQQEAGKNGAEIVLVAVKVDAFMCERAKNARRKFLS
ncbi:hypothetical protein EPUS_07746 [Endocarpon pusillum Z07020]|uniref:Potassium channel tetramerisation-type BTB domain-containing protein n=1 Tax=Endocarpon pusillum (strain Z07020 / HMAS-L-300199) TaxID=1263415 RepID=U1GNN2_ENDPU|nr:uncharacterized protein EPUS_07746 [Endocarpon pusillum Z07020]ERF73541.1 hypothetical protein EPUS_07746 [Endocarpon pusillum Z07020]